MKKTHKKKIEKHMRKKGTSRKSGKARPTLPSEIKNISKKGDQKSINLKKEIRKREGFAPELPSQKKVKS